MTTDEAIDLLRTHVRLPIGVTATVWEWPTFRFAYMSRPSDARMNARIAEAFEVLLGGAGVPWIERGANQTDAGSEEEPCPRDETSE